MIGNIKKIITGIMAALIALGGGVYVAEEMRGGGDPPGLVKVWDATNKTVIIGSDTGVPEMTVRLISSEPDLCTFTEIFEVTNFKAFTPHKDKDFKARTVKQRGNKSVTAVEWFIEQNVSYTVNITDYKVVQVEKEVYNNKTGKNETILVNETIISGYHDETRYKTEWQDYKLHGKPVSGDSVQRIKVVYRKPPEVGEVSIQTIPMFRGAECDELTWWNTSWDNKREIKVDNTGGSALTYYQVNVNLTSTPINSSSLRVVNETADATVPHWQETISSGNCTDLWFNTTSIPASAWLNGTYYMYYGNAGAASAWDIRATMLDGDDFPGSSLNATIWDNQNCNIGVSGGILTLDTFTGGLTGGVMGKRLLPITHVIESKIKNTYSGDVVQIGNSNVFQIRGDDSACLGLNNDATLYMYTTNEGTLSYCGPSGYNVNQYYNIKIVLDGAGVHCYYDGTELTGSPITTNYPNEQTYLRIGGDSSTSPTAQTDWIFARKYTATEPTASLGAEEDSFSITSYAPATPLNKNEGDSQLFNVTAAESCQCRWYIDGALVQTNATPATDHAYTNTSLALGANQNFSAVVNTSPSSDMQTWDVTVIAAGAFQQSVYKDSWQYVTNLNSTDRTFSQFFSQMSAYYLIRYNKTAQRTYGYKSGRWTKYADYNIPSGDAAMLRYTANDTLTRDNATGTFSGTLKTGLNHIGHSYNGTKTLHEYNASINSNNVSTITFSYPNNGTTNIYTYGSSANGTVGVAQGFGVEVNVTADTPFAGL